MVYSRSKNTFQRMSFNLFAMLIAGIISAQDTAVNLGSYGTLFGDVHESDASAALKVLANNLAKRIKEEDDIAISFDQKIYSSLEQVSKDLFNNKIDCINLPIFEYFELSKTNDLEPVLVGNSSNTPFTKYLIVSGNHSSIENFEDLENKSISIPKMRYNFVLEMWLLKIFRERVEKSWQEYFTSVTYGENESKVLLSVFFKKSDACIITEESYKIYTELNPQVKQNTKIIAESPNLIPGLFAVVKSMDPKLKNLFIAKTKSLHEDKDGRQILDLFKINLIHFITPEDLNPTKELYDNYKMIGINK